MTSHSSFAACAFDESMEERIEYALKVLLRTGPLCKKVGDAARCLTFLREEEFPNEIAADVKLLFSVGRYVRYLGTYGEYADYSRIPRRIQREWFPALLRVYRLLMIAKGAASVLPMAEAAKVDEACRENISEFEGCRFERCRPAVTAKNVR